jgi:hypothetical protein
MGLRSHRQNLVVWNQSAGSADRYDARRFTRPTRTRRIRGWIRTGALLSVAGLMALARAVRVRWRPLLAGAVLTVTGALLRDGPAGVILLPGLMCLISAPLMPDRPKPDRTRCPELERELATYSTPAQRRELEATLDQYPDGITYELRDILTSRGRPDYDNRFRVIGRH